MIDNCSLVIKLFKQKFSQFKSVSQYSNSCVVVNKALLLLADTDGQDMLIAYGDQGPVIKALSGEQIGELKLCPLNHDNRLVINRFLPFTAPVALGRNTASIGLGDRLGLANYAHLQALQGSGMKPVLAQQSLRELTLTGRTYDDVLDAASWSVFKSGWRGGYAADGDHLKHEKDIAMALDCGYTMITLDCSDVLIDAPESSASLDAAYQSVSPIIRAQIEKEYLENEDAKALGIGFDRFTLMRIVVTYYAGIKFAVQIYENYIVKAGRPVDFELSLDETGQVTTLAAHYFVANELKKANVYLTSLAPHFVGEFQKAVDYIGNVELFRSDLRAHALIAKHFGYRLSIHSGSDKFSIFPYVGAQTNGCFHLKTSGTSWLEAVKVIAEKEPHLYRDMHQCALDNFEKAKAYYVVHANVKKIIPLEKVTDGDLPDYMAKDDSRQLLHITYGFMFADKALKTRIFEALNKHRASYEAGLRTHIGRHLNAIKSGQEEV